MKPIRIEFASHHSRQRDIILLLVLFLCVIAAVAGIVVGNSFSRKAAENRVLVQQISADQDSLDEAVQYQKEASTGVVASIRVAVQMLNYPSIDLLTQLERHARPDIQPVSIEMGPVRSNFRLIVQAPGTGPVLDYVEALKQEPDLHGIALVRQEKTNGADIGGAGALRFTLDVQQPNLTVRPTARATRGTSAE